MNPPMMNAPDHGSMPRPDHREAGVSLIEMSLALVVSAIMLGSVLSGVLQHAALRRVTEEKKLAMQAIVSNMELARSLDDAGIAALNDVDFDVPSADGSPGGLRAQPDDADGLPGKIVVILAASSGGYNIYLVTAEVAWTGVKGRRDLSVQTYLGARK